MGTNLKPEATGNAQCIFHVGLPKTGTTFLQKRWFPRLPVFDYYSTELPYRWPRQLGWIYQLNQEGFRPGCMAVASGNPSGARAVALMAARNNPYWLDEGRSFLAQLQRPTLFSSEGLAGHSLHVNEIHARLIRDIFGPAKIIFIFRRQAEWLMSLWRQLVLVEDRFSRYVEPLPLVEKGDDGTALIDMNWRAYVDSFDVLFGADNVLALPYEQMLVAPQSFVAEIAAFIGSSPGEDVNFGSRENVFDRDMTYVGWKMDDWLSSETGYRIRKTLRRPGILDRVRCSPVAGLLLRETTPAPFGDDLKSRITNEYAASNRALGKRLGKDLAAYGYY